MTSPLISASTAAKNYTSPSCMYVHASTQMHCTNSAIFHRLKTTVTTLQINLNSSTSAIQKLPLTSDDQPAVKLPD